MVDAAGGQANHVDQALEHSGAGTRLNQSGGGPFQDRCDEKSLFAHRYGSNHADVNPALPGVTTKSSGMTPAKAGARRKA
jgi:hypothetical protein